MLFFTGLLVALVSSACGGAQVPAGDCLTNAGKDLNKLSRCASSATLVFDGAPSASIQEGSGTTVSQTYRGSPELNYSGATGCEARAFAPGEAGLFRYSSRDAYLVWSGRVYHFIAGPRQRSGVLVFDQSFSGHQVAVWVVCPPPPASGPLLPASY